MLFSVWPCSAGLDGDPAVCRPVNFSDPTKPPACFSAAGTACVCPDVEWSSGVNISNSRRVTVRGIAIDYTPRALPAESCKPSAPPPPATPLAGHREYPRRDYETRAPASYSYQFNSGRRYTYHIFNSSQVVTEDVVIISAPFMAITSFLGSGGHVFRRVSFKPNATDPNALIAGKDGLHESDVRQGLQFIDSTIHGTADDFFNLRNTLQIVYRCDFSTTHSCLVVSPHINGVPANTVYGSPRVLTTVRAGDRFSFYPLSHFQHPENNTPPLLATAVVRSAASVTDGALLKRVSAWAQRTASNATNRLMHFGDGSDLWNISFVPTHALVRSNVRPTSLVNIDTISGAGAVIRNCEFSVTACNLGRTKSSNSIITNNTFRLAASRNLEVTGLQIWFEGPLYISNVSITDNTFIGEGPKGTVVHVSKIATNVRIEGNKYLPADATTHHAPSSM